MKHIWKGAVMLTLSAFLIAVIWGAGVLLFSYLHSRNDAATTLPLQKISAGLRLTKNGYQFSGAEYTQTDAAWLMLIGKDGAVVWSQDLPPEVPRQYSLSDVASFSRWYLQGYPVQMLIRSDGILVVGTAKGSAWKYNITLPQAYIRQLPWLCGGLLLAALSCTLLVSVRLSRRWFRKEQGKIDAARSDWINGVSHDVRTPLSLVMGYAGQMEQDAALPEPYRRQAAIIRSQSQNIRDLVNDLNLTMRLNGAMQPLRLEQVDPAALLRQVTADFLNQGLAAAHPVELELPEQPLPALSADPFLLRRAIGNLLTNCVRHNPPDCPISLGAAVQKNCLCVWVESKAAAQPPGKKPKMSLTADGEAAHGTGLQLVEQITATHGGTVRFFTGDRFRCELTLPLAEKRRKGHPVISVK